MGKTIKTGNVPIIGQKEKNFTWHLTVTIDRRDVEGKKLPHIINTVEKEMAPAVNTIIAQVADKAAQWAAETEQEKRFLSNDN